MLKSNSGETFPKYVGVKQKRHHQSSQGEECDSKIKDSLSRSTRLFKKNNMEEKYRNILGVAPFPVIVTTRTVTLSVGVPS